MSFVHLHTHTEYSLLDGSNKIKEYVSRVKELGMDSAAITDHGVMYGVIDFYKAAKAAGIKPILGCEVYVAPNSRFDRETISGEDRYYHLILLAENDLGYSNLVKIVSKGFTEGYYYKPRVDMEVLEAYHEGIIASSACLAGEVARNITRNNYEEAKNTALRLEACFGKGNFFLELQDHGMPEQHHVNSQLLRLSEDTGIELIATNDVHYTYESDAKAHDLLLCIQTGAKVSDENRMRYEGGQYFVKSEEQMRELFPYARQALENTQKIADRCNVTIEFGNTKLPRFEVSEGYTSSTYLRKLCEDGLKKRYPDTYESLQDQLDYELSIIEKMGYVDYFLIVWDYINYARTKGIPVGPGRGSAAGSLVAYTTGITNIDPIRYSLIFERFLNPERVSMPDIDVDFCYERREEVIDYVVEKYGKECVTQIVTFGTLLAKGVIRDVGRVMDLPYNFVDQIAKSIPNELGITIDKALEMNHELKSMYDSDAQVHELIDMSRRLEGLPRHTSTHAAGVVISQMPMEEYVPLSRGTDGMITTQFTMTTIEELGLLKMDFLGLRTLTVINDALKMIEKNRGIHIDIDAIDYDDKAVLESIGTGKTEGVFQLESAGMKNFMKELKPKSLEDVIAGISLYRPGPMDFIPAYIRGKNNPSSIVYDCPQLEPILAPTYGCIVYQEQVMQIVRDLAGYTLGRSDLVRRAMSKKKGSVMEEERRNFVYGNEEQGVPGCVSKGIDAAVANKIYDEMIDFAKYAFNKSHAAAYAVVSYQTAYLKYYYPVEFMAALMTSVKDNGAKVSEYILTCRRMGIPILPPDINEGEGDFSVAVVKGTSQSAGNEEAQEVLGIRYGMSAIKNVGTPMIASIVEERKIRGAFLNLNDFITRMDGEVNRRAMENFVKAGAMDCFEGNRYQKTLLYPRLMDKSASDKKKTMPGQVSLFDLVAPEEKKEYQIAMPNVEEFPREELLGYEKEVLGVYVSGHPLEEYENIWRKNINAVTTDFMYDEELGGTTVKDDSVVVIGGMITECVIKYTKNNKTMAFLTIEDLLGTAEVIVFPRDYEKYKSLMQNDAKVFIRGRVNVEEEKNGKLILEKMVSFSDTKKELWIQCVNKEDYAMKEAKMYDLLRSSDGKDEVVIYLAEEKAIKRLPPNWNIGIEQRLISELVAIFGEKNIKVVEKSIENLIKRD